jgi:hypothetical protein
VWGSAGIPPRPNLGGDWPHDVYYAWVDRNGTTGSPQVLVSGPEAQEPPSAAINSLGTILMTCEDGDGSINQRAGMWDSSLRVVRKYPFTIKRGGHSGHVAALGPRFLVAYGEGWVDGGGFLGLGTGKNVLARIVGSDGTLGREIHLTSDRVARHRDGWPLVAASKSNWLVVWQRYPELSLQAALIDASGGVARRKIVDGLTVRYAYDVAYTAQLDMYVVAGSLEESGFVSLVNPAGDIVTTQRGLPPMVSESRIVLGSDGTHAIGVYPVSPRGIAVVRMSAKAVDLVKIIDHPHPWDYSGTTGTFVAPGRVLFATLSTTGLHVFLVDLALSGATGRSRPLPTRSSTTSPA